jgi:hypothetical protein
VNAPVAIEKYSSMAWAAAHFSALGQTKAFGKRRLSAEIRRFRNLPKSGFLTF